MIFDRVLDVFRGRAVTIPPLDGAYRANTALDDAPVFTAVPEADNLCAAGGRLLASSGTDLVALTPGEAPEVVQHCAAPITALAALPEGRLAIALDDGSLTLNGAPVALPAGVGCITALAYAADGTLWLANGSDSNPASGWATDLMQKNASGSVWRRAPGGDWQRVAGGLGWPNGLLPEADGSVVVSESWRHRLIRLGAGAPTPVLRHLPGYPARLMPAAGGGAWLALFAPRNRLIELVLQEKHYRLDMIAEVPRAFWIAPAMASGNNFLEPLQCGGIRTMGVHKAWAPSRSYGLVVKLGPDMAPLWSLHSRANGSRHGTTSAIEADGRLLVASRGGGAILSVEAM